MARRRRRHRRKGRFAVLYKLMTFLLICGALVAALALLQLGRRLQHIEQFRIRPVGQRQEIVSVQRMFHSNPRVEGSGDLRGEREALQLSLG